MDEQARQQAFLSALVTEHFVLQSARGVTTSEAGNRSSLYLTALSSGLVALGFAAGTDALLPFAAAVLPALVVLGLFTYVRLVETSIENVLLLRSIQKIRGYYRELVPEGPEYFPGGDQGDMVITGSGRRSGRAELLFTAASMIAAINAILTGAGLAFLIGDVGRPVAVAVGIGTAAAVFGLHLAHQERRFAADGGEGGRAAAGSGTPTSLR